MDTQESLGVVLGGNRSEWISDIEQLAARCVLAIPSVHTKRIYTQHIRNFLSSRQPLTRDGVQWWLNSLQSHSAKPATLAQALAAVKKLAKESKAQGMISEVEYFGIHNIEVKAVRGNRAGNWLTKEQIKLLYAQPNRATLQGKRDAALFALLIGCGLRREECASLTWNHYRAREGRMCIVDIVGKGNRIRTVPVPKHAEADLSAWRKQLMEYGLGGDDERLLRRLRKNPKHEDARLEMPLTADGVWHIVREYSRQVNIQFAPHDLRRSMAKAMYSAGADVFQIQLTLGHSSINTTRLYLGIDLDLVNSATDTLELEED